MRKKWDRDVLAFISFVLLVSGLGLVRFLSFDDDSWEQTEDPACYLHTHVNRHLFGADSTERARYCEVSP